MTMFKRVFTIQKDTIDIANRTVKIAFASEEPYMRSDGLEIVRVNPIAMDLSRLLNGAPLLFNHNADSHIGVVEACEFSADGKARAIVRFGKGQFAEEKWQDVLDGILTKISYGYMVLEVIEGGVNENGVRIYFVSKSLPYEISMVAIAADDTVGVGRSLENQNTEETEEEKAKKLKEAEVIEPAEVDAEKKTIDTTEEQAPKEEIIAEEKQVEKVEVKSEEAPQKTAEEPEAEKNIKNKDEESQEKFDNQKDLKENTFKQQIVIHSKGKKMEYKDEVKEITALSRQHNDNDGAVKFINEGKSLAEYKDHLIAKRTTEIGALEKKFDTSKQKYDTGRMAFSAFSQEKSYERELSDKIAQDLGLKARSEFSMFVPIEFASKRNYNIVGSGNLANGGTLVENTLLNDMINPLYANMVVMKAGARVLEGLKGEVDVPKRNASTTEPTFINSETTNVPLTNSTFGRVQLRRKTQTGGFEISRDMLNNTNFNVLSIAIDDLIRDMSQKMDKVLLKGDGTDGGPLGILNTPGITEVLFGTGGGTPVAGSPTWAKMINLLATVASKNAIINPNSFSYITDPLLAYNLETIARSGSNNGFIAENQVVAGKQLLNTTSLNPTGANHTIVAGDFSQMLIGLFGVMEIEINPHITGPKGGKQVYSFMDYDCAVRHPESFVFADDILLG